MSDLSEFDRELLAQMREDFLSESQEILDRLGTHLAHLEQSATPDLLNTIFREVHTLKGTAGFVSFHGIQRLSHKLEDVFGEVREGKLAVTPDLIDVTFSAWQALNLMRHDIVHGGAGETDIMPYLERLGALLEQDGSATEPPPVYVPPEAEPASFTVQSMLQPKFGSTVDTKPIQPSPTDATLRVETETLDTLMTLVGELITARNSLIASAERLDDPTLQSDTNAINRLTRQLQNTVSSVRLTPIERLLSRFTPVVRNLARERGKFVRYIIEGGDTPLDRAVSEQIYDPLIHMLRNAIDHGLETPDVRRRAGKPDEGTLRISAERLGDDVVLRVADDGGGINPNRIRAVAVERGLYSQDEVANLSEDEAIRLIFSPGFSTSTTVTDISGRGVGMDVVLENVRRLRGAIDIETELGRGTTFVIKLPLTLAILQVLLVRVGLHMYAVPLHAVRETLRLQPEAIHFLHRSAITYVHDNPLPLRRLSDWLLPTSTSHALVEQQPALVVGLARGDEVVLVDELVGKQQMVIKPLNPYLGQVTGVEGAAILPDGTVGLVLDLERLLT